MSCQFEESRFIFYCPVKTGKVAHPLEVHFQLMSNLIRSGCTPVLFIIRQYGGRCSTFKVAQRLIGFYDSLAALRLVCTTGYHLNKIKTHVRHTLTHGKHFSFTNSNFLFLFVPCDHSVWGRGCGIISSAQNSFVHKLAISDQIILMNFYNIA